MRSAAQFVRLHVPNVKRNADNIGMMKQKIKKFLKKILLVISPLYRKINNNQEKLETIQAQLVNMQNSYEENTQNILTFLSGEGVYFDAFKTQTILKLRRKNGKSIDYEDILEFHYIKLINSGDTVFDIGAHGGRHLSVFKRLVGNQGVIYAFEPLPAQYEALIENFNDENIVIENIALSNTQGEIEFFH